MHEVTHRAGREDCPAQFNILPARRIRIMPQSRAVSRTDLSITTVDEQLPALVMGYLASRINSLFLCIKDCRYSAVPRASDSPRIPVRNNMLIAFERHGDSSLNAKTGVERRRRFSPVLHPLLVVGATSCELPLSAEPSGRTLYR
jgi:hypothetical protein